MFPFRKRSDDFPFESEVDSTMSWSVFVFWSMFFFGPAAYFIYQGEYIVPVILISAGICAFSGYRLGALSILTSVAALAAAIGFAPSIGMNYEEQFQEWLGTTGLVNRGVAIAVIALSISMAVWTIISLTIGRVVRRRPGLDRMNRGTGFLIGIGQGVVGAVLLVGGLLYIEPIQRARLESQNIEVDSAPAIMQMVFRATEQVDHSIVGPVFRKHNPIEKIPQLQQIKQIQKTATVLADPQQMNRVIEHPAVVRLRQTPEVQAAVMELRSDQEIQAILQRGEPMNQETAMKLLRHPAVMRLIDQPGFLESAKEAIDDITQ